MRLSKEKYANTRRKVMSTGLLRWGPCASPGANEPAGHPSMDWRRFGACHAHLATSRRVCSAAKVRMMISGSAHLRVGGPLWRRHARRQRRLRISPVAPPHDSCRFQNLENPFLSTEITTKFSSAHWRRANEAAPGFEGYSLSASDCRYQALLAAHS